MKEAPYLLRQDGDELKMQSDNLSKLTSDIMPVGTVREFMVGPVAPTPTPYEWIIPAILLLWVCQPLWAELELIQGHQWT